MGILDLRTPREPAFGAAECVYRTRPPVCESLTRLMTCRDDLLYALVMTADSFEQSLEFVLEHEGGYVDNPDDPGGATNMGVTQNTYDAYRSDRGVRSRSVRRITHEEVAAIYRMRYWDAMRCDDLADGLDYTMFDCAVLHGPRRATEFLHGAINTGPDEAISEQTLALVAKYNAATVIKLVSDARMAYFRTLDHWRTFGAGWTNRIYAPTTGVRNRALSLSGADPCV